MSGSTTSMPLRSFAEPQQPFTLRPYTPADEDAAMELWRQTWQAVYPKIDFSARLDWWRNRWRTELVGRSTITVAEADGRMIGFVTVDPVSLELDQLVVSLDAWGGGIAGALLAEAKRISPHGVDLHVNTDNHRAVRFYQKHGFVISGEAINWRSGAPVHKMSWRPSDCAEDRRDVLPPSRPAPPADFPCKGGG